MMLTRAVGPTSMTVCSPARTVLDPARHPGNAQNRRAQNLMC